jgi:hypothetical protein
MLASLAPPGSPDVDILVLSPDQTVMASVQVKTQTYGRDQGWHMSEKHEAIVEDWLFYTFVDLEAEPPTTYIVPSKTVAEVITRSHRLWLISPEEGAGLIESRSSAGCVTTTRRSMFSAIRGLA